MDICNYVNCNEAATEIVSSYSDFDPLLCVKHRIFLTEIRCLYKMPNTDIITITHLRYLISIKIPKLNDNGHRFHNQRIDPESIKFKKCAINTCIERYDYFNLHNKFNICNNKFIESPLCKDHSNQLDDLLSKYSIDDFNGWNPTKTIKIIEGDFIIMDINYNQPDNNQPNNNQPNNNQPDGYLK